MFMGNEVKAAQKYLKIQNFKNWKKVTKRKQQILYINRCWYARLRDKNFV